jgi:hypothetical protein
LSPITIGGLPLPGPLDAVPELDDDADDPLLAAVDDELDFELPQAASVKVSASATASTFKCDGNDMCSPGLVG